jgi:hypothetical protein
MTLGTFHDAMALVPMPERLYIVYAPLAVLATILLIHGKVASRVPPNPVLHVIAFGLAAAHVPALLMPLPYEPATRVLLIAVVVLILLRLKPRIGDLYQSMPIEGFIAFLALTALLFQSIGIVQELAAVGVTHRELARIPLPMANLAAAAIVVMIFIVASGIRHRPQQLNPSKRWLYAGLAVWFAGAAATHLHGTQYAQYAQYAKYALVAGHVMLFIGAFYMLSHLLPSRDADKLH